MHTPHLLAFNYMITYINWHTKENLGNSARALIILDEKAQYDSSIKQIIHARRFEGPTTHRVKWIVEFSYSIDSKKNPMVQLSDLVVLCARRFFEVENGYKERWPNEVKHFYAQCYDVICSRIRRKNLVTQTGRSFLALNNYLSQITCSPVGRWRQRYGL